ncbi:Cof-type HAD-IIB family hydrolase [Paenibacillus donghaensis]|uniref:Phosphatase n=1 Tax=Paenibacillus donghaensis TaxID=414771 RepID=A0A2Z2K7S3_9BACL|nr:Cof-type HAD-IIB family hydrolase [Paenibacillus donghaensis]ASA21194.1 phosphatase [Paenibacillus donghaensis]
MTDKSIIFFDIDGTLLDEEKKLPPTTKQAILELKACGHDVAIATGRAPFMFEELRQELDIDTFVCYNGQYAVLRGEVIHKHPLDPLSLQVLTDVALLHNHAIVYMDHMDMKANVPNNEFIASSFGTFKTNLLPAHDANYYKDREIYQSLLLCQELEESYYEEVFPSLHFVRWHANAVDVVPTGGSKAKGIAKITELLGIAPEHQYAFGDALNDVEMLSTIVNSVAMGNGMPEAKAAAKYITKPVHEDGIWHGLRMVGLL